jgi:hypothetical protein
LSSIGSKQAYITKEALVNSILLYKNPLTCIIKKLANFIGIKKQANPIKQTKPYTNYSTT